MTVKRTDELVRGDVVRLPGGRTATVGDVIPTGYLNRRNQPILQVRYDRYPQGWGSANTAAPGSIWDLA